MAIPRTLGAVIQARAVTLRRRAMVAVSELRGDYPVTVNVIRREPAGPAASSRGVTTAWSTIAGLSGLQGHVRYNGRWVEKATGAEVELRENERIVMIADLPAGGSAGVNDLLTTDRLQFTDDTYGQSVWMIREIRDRNADGLCWALCEWAREE